MFNILMVDDEERVRKRIKRAFRPYVENCTVFTAPDGEVAMGIMKAENIDLMIVDYLLGPPYQGDELIRLIRGETFLAGKYEKIPIILMTGTEGLRALKLSMVSLGVAYHLKKDGDGVLVEKALNLLDPKNYSITIEEALDDPHYDYKGISWYEDVQPEFQSVTLDECPTKQADVAIMVATEVEFDQVARLFMPLKPNGTLYKVPHEYETYYVGKFGAFDSVFIKCDMGSMGPQSSLTTAQELEKTWQPKVIVMLGIAFAQDREKYLPGDVLVATMIIPYENERVSVREDIYRGPVPPVGLLLHNRFANVTGWTFRRPDGSLVSVHSGPLLSGEKLVDDPVFKKKLFDNHPQAIGGEMEAAGLYVSAARKKLDWIVVKGVSDWGDGKKHNDFQKLAAASASSLAHHVFSDQNALEGLDPRR